MEQLGRYQRLQCLYNKSNIAIRCFRRLTTTDNIYAMNEIFELLNAMLKYGNREVQVYLLNLIKNSATQTSDLFRYIKSQFADSVKRKLILEIAARPAPAPPERMMKAQAYDCLIGEKKWESNQFDFNSP